MCAVGSPSSTCTCEPAGRFPSVGPHVTFELQPSHTMSTILKRKVALINRLTTLDDERTIAAMERLLEGGTHDTLSEEQLQQLEASWERHLRGEARTYTPAQVKARALKAIGR